MHRVLVSSVLVALLVNKVASAEDWKMQSLQIPTRWAALVRPDNALPEYPRPQLVRRHGWKNLNGLWDYAITPSDGPRPSQYQGKILVPYPLESALSGVQKPLRPDQLLWYRRSFDVPSTEKSRRVLLHFGAVDFRATVYVNDKEIGTHSGGYQSFTFDVTDELKVGPNELLVKVFDPTDAGPNPHGKQVLFPKKIFYTSSSGIWQTVWVEDVPQTYIARVTTTPDVDRSQVLLDVQTDGQTARSTIEAVAYLGTTAIATQVVNGTSAMRINHPRLWSPDDPFLYDLRVRLVDNGKVIDEVHSYFGLRKIEVKKDPAGLQRIFLNGKYTYNLGLLDQGFWPDGLYTAPTDAALKFDIQAAKAMGFNTIRKHIKVEPERWYYYCDKLGILVWQDMVPPANASVEAHAQFKSEIEQNLNQLHNHPSIITWVLFNEGWGTDSLDQSKLARWMKALDPSRLLDAHSGPNFEAIPEWEKHLDPSSLSRLMKGDDEPLAHAIRYLGLLQPARWEGGDMTDIHMYPNPQLPSAFAGRVRVLGEHGGIGVAIDGHTWEGLAGMGYVDVSPVQLPGRYGKLVDELKSFEAQGLSASIYTQPFDVEGEQNGLMTYDRAVIKIPIGELLRINAQLVPKSRNYALATSGFVAEAADLTPLQERYEKFVREYLKGNRDPAFLRHLCVTAIQQHDQELATKAADELIERTQRPYSRDLWAFIQATTRTSHDKGFELLRRQARQADEALGPDAAESAVRQVIAREEIEPYTPKEIGRPLWADIEKRVGAKYGELGLEEVYGAEMIGYLERQDWLNFAKYYVLYFDTAVARTEYSITDLSYTLFQHVTDATALAAAIRVSRSYLDLGDLRGSIKPADLDTYANLLYKAGKHEEAIEWEEKAVRLSNGLAPEIEENLLRMKAGRPTWSVS